MSLNSPTALAEKLYWEKGEDPKYPYALRKEGKEYLVRLNDFPAEKLYTLLINGEEVADFEDWPDTWKRPQETTLSRLLRTNPSSLVGSDDPKLN